MVIIMTEYELRGWQYWPNRFIYDPRLQQAEILCVQAKDNGDWPLNRALLIYAMELVLQGWSVDVLLRDEDNARTITKCSITLLAFCLDEMPNIDGQHGPYYWIDKDFDLVPSLPRAVLA